MQRGSPCAHLHFGKLWVGPHSVKIYKHQVYCGFGNFRLTFISRFFHFRIICEFLNSRASIRVVGHFRGLKIGALCISCVRQINVMHRTAAHAVRQLKLEILFVLLSQQRDTHSVCNTY